MPARGLVRDFNPLASARENHRVLADDIAPAKRRETNIASLARAGLAFAGKYAGLFKVDATAPGRRLTQAKRGSRWRIDLAIVMDFKDLNVELVVQGSGNLFNQHKKKIHAEAHIRRENNRYDFRRLGHRGVSLRVQARCTNDPRSFRVHRGVGVLGDRLRQREVNDGPRGGEQRGGIANRLDSKRSKLANLTDINALMGTTRPYRPPGEPCISGLQDLTDDHCPHCTGDPCNAYRQFLHPTIPQF